MNKIELGEKVRDTITGIKGTATARAEYLHCNPSILVEWYDGKVSQEWFPESRLELI